MSDGWQDLIRHKRMTWTYDRAADGNVALTGEVDLPTTADGFVIAVGFGRNAAEAGQRARASLMDGFEVARTEYVRQWLGWQERTRSLDVEGAEPYPLNLWKISTAVLRTHEAKRFPGGLIASLAIPWGDTKGDEDLGGYHLVWPRDLCESAGGLLAIGALDDARRVIDYLRVTQEGDGHWPQNMWLDGRAYWGGVQMDETAYVILLVDLARREGALEDGAGEELWPMVRRAAGYLVRNGPVTPQDRWEEDPGYSPFTLAVEISALLAAADLADANGEGTTASFLRETADVWNAGIERWTYVTDTALARATGVDGYYVRIAPPETSDASSPVAGFVAIKNRPPSDTDRPAAQTVSPDALALVRFGLRSADDLRIANTVKVIDALLKVETPFGPAWYRYNDDGYGEHEDGTAFDGTGIGRPWPLLTGERAHYELAAGRRDVALRLLAAMEGFANEGGLIPEQIWDADDIPERELACGRPSGSAMPLAWAHAEYIKLRRSLRDGRVFDLPPQTVERYVNNESSIRRTTWRFNNKCSGMRPGDRLRVETLAPARVQWTITTDEGRTDPRVHEAMTRDTGLGVYIADLPTEQMESGATIAFTFYWPEDDRWEGIDYSVEVLLD
jgi:glucoamylase